MHLPQLNASMPVVISLGKLGKWSTQVEPYVAIAGYHTQQHSGEDAIQYSLQHGEYSQLQSMQCTLPASACLTTRLELLLGRRQDLVENDKLT